MEQHFPEFPKRGQRREVYPNFRKNFSRKFSFHSTLFLEFLEFSVKWSAFRKFNSEIRGYFCNICRCFQFFETFCWMENAHLVSCRTRYFCLLLSPGLYRRFRRTVLAPVADQLYPLSSTAPFRNLITDIHSVHSVSSQLQGPCSIGHLVRFVCLCLICLSYLHRKEFFQECNADIIYVMLTDLSNNKKETKRNGVSRL